jgi:hypothetical protein
MKPKQWPVSAEMRQKTVDKLAKMIASGDVETVCRAAMLMIRMDRANVTAEMEHRRFLATEEGRRMKLIELAARLPAGEIRRIAERHGLLPPPNGVEDDVE